jgi:hypothetical protein
VNNLCTLRGPQAPEQGKHVPEVGLELHSSPCKHWAPAETYGIRPNPPDVRPIPKPNVWTLSTTAILRVKGLTPTAAPRIEGVRHFFVLQKLILPEESTHGCNRVMPALAANSWAGRAGFLVSGVVIAISPPFSPSMVRSADSRMTGVRPPPQGGPQGPAGSR